MQHIRIRLDPQIWTHDARHHIDMMRSKERYRMHIVVCISYAFKHSKSFFFLFFSFRMNSFIWRDFSDPYAVDHQIKLEHQAFNSHEQISDKYKFSVMPVGVHLRFCPLKLLHISVCWARERLFCISFLLHFSHLFLTYLVFFLAVGWLYTILCFGKTKEVIV